MLPAGPRRLGRHRLRGRIRLPPRGGPGVFRVAWREIAALDPDGIDDSSWTGYQRVSGDGRYAAASILPASAVNPESARDHGGFAYSVNLSTGAQRDGDHPAAIHGPVR